MAKKKVISLHLDPELLIKIDKLAALEMRSRTQQINYLLCQKLSVTAT